MDFKAKARYRYIELTYLENKNSKREKKCLLNFETLRESLLKFDKLAPNRIITNIEILCAIEML